MALKMHPSLAVHVGDWLKTEIVEPAQVSVTALAQHFGVSRQALSTLLNGNANLSADMAIRFEKAFGIKADTLLRMQTTYELAQAREELAAARAEGWRAEFLAMSPRQEELVEQFCMEIAGRRGEPGSPPDPVRLLEMAQALYEAERKERAP